MRAQKLFWLGGLVLAGSAVAQGTVPVVGKTADVQGLVTMSVGTTVSNVTGTLGVVDGSRFVTSSNGTVTIKLDNGCEIKLEPNQSLVVDKSKPCAALIASVQPVGAPGAVAGGARGALMAAGLLIGGGALVNAQQGSGSAPAGTGGGGGAGGGGNIPNLPPSGQ
jgi:hypothetical protein